MAKSAKKKYVAYVGTYTTGKSEGIHLYDLDTEANQLTLRKVIPCKNASYVRLSKNKKYLYSIADEGVRVFEVLPDGDLTPFSEIDMDGMRGHHMTSDAAGRFLFVAGFHDAKLTVIELNEEGNGGHQVSCVYHNRQGGIRDRSWWPHICTVRMTRDDKYVCAVDDSLNQIVIYRLNKKNGKLTECEIIRMGSDVGPRNLHFSKDGKFAYVLCEISSTVRVYQVGAQRDGTPDFQLIQEVTTLSNKRDPYDAAASMRLSDDGSMLMCSSAGDNSVAIFSVDEETGMLSTIVALPTSGDFPKDAAFMPDQRHIAVVNNSSNTITTFAFDVDKHTLVMKGRPQKVDQPNCILIKEL
ncbi:MAG: lactonase family protein [Lachnospiraceae bacterium]|nr:lactonase family protein [Candidatus Equihabitans merdae]